MVQERLAELIVIEGAGNWRACGRPLVVLALAPDKDGRGKCSQLGCGQSPRGTGLPTIVTKMLGVILKDLSFCTLSDPHNRF